MLRNNTQNMHTTRNTIFAYINSYACVPYGIPVVCYTVGNQNKYYAQIYNLHYEVYPKFKLDLSNNKPLPQHYLVWHQMSAHGPTFNAIDPATNYTYPLILKEIRNQNTLHNAANPSYAEMLDSLSPLLDVIDAENAKTQAQNHVIEISDSEEALDENAEDADDAEYIDRNSNNHKYYSGIFINDSKPALFFADGKSVSYDEKIYSFRKSATTIYLIKIEYRLYQFVYTAEQNQEALFLDEDHTPVKNDKNVYTIYPSLYSKPFIYDKNNLQIPVTLALPEATKKRKRDENDAGSSKIQKTKETESSHDNPSVESPSSSSFFPKSAQAKKRKNGFRTIKYDTDAQGNVMGKFKI